MYDSLFTRLVRAYLFFFFFFTRSTLKTDLPLHLLLFDLSEVVTLP